MLVGAQEQEVLRLQIPVHHSHGVAIVDDPDNLTAEIGGGALGVVALGDDPVEELAAGAELHDEIDGVAILVGAFELHDVPVAGHVVHDLDLAANVLDVVSVDQLPGGDRFARELLLRFLVGHQVGDTELSAPELAPKDVRRPDVLHGPPEDAAHGGGGGSWGWGWNGGEVPSRRTGIGREDVDGAIGGALVVRDSAGVAGILLAAAVAHFWLGGACLVSGSQWEIVGVSPCSVFVNTLLAGCVRNPKEVGGCALRNYHNGLRVR